MTKFNNVRLTGITVNMKQGEIHLSAVIAFNDENFAKSQTLTPYLDAETGGVTLDVEPDQPRLWKTEVSAEVVHEEKQSES